MHIKFHVYHNLMKIRRKPEGKRTNTFRPTAMPWLRWLVAGLSL
jgi:hypothetical protein